VEVVFWKGSSAAQRKVLRPSCRGREGNHFGGGKRRVRSFLPWRPGVKNACGQRTALWRGERDRKHFAERNLSTGKVSKQGTLGDSHGESSNIFSQENRTLVKKAFHSLQRRKKMAGFLGDSVFRGGREKVKASITEKNYLGTIGKNGRESGIPKSSATTKEERD